jgi:putative LysE/RhtB family amino acid efflux pump
MLILIALRAFWGKPAKEVVVSGKTMASSCLSCFVLTVSNPATIIGFAALFAAFGIGASDDKIHAFIVITGVFTGSMLWWVFLSFFVARMRFANLIERAEIINKYLAVLLALLGIWSIVSAFI